MLENIEGLIDDVGVAASASGLVGIALNPRRPRYLLGAAIGIPATIAFGERVPDIVANGLGGAYVGGLIGYGLASIGSRSSRREAAGSLIGGVIGAGSVYALLHYL